MPSFRAIEVWTDLACASGARVAVFGPDALLSATLTESLTGAEGCAITVPATMPGVSELVERRVLRVLFSAPDGTVDTAATREYRIAEVNDGGDGSPISVRGDVPLLDLARAVYWVHDAQGRAGLTITAAQMTASEAIDAYVLPACDDAGLTFVERGTVDSTEPFDVSGDWSSALELLRWLADRSQTGQELRLRRNGDTDYRIDLVASVGSSAAVVYVETAKNLTSLQRRRDTLQMVTRCLPQGRSGASERTLGRALWRV